MGILSGNHKDIDSDIIFCTIQTLSKDNVLHSFNKDEFEKAILEFNRRNRRFGG